MTRARAASGRTRRLVRVAGVSVIALLFAGVAATSAALSLAGDGAIGPALFLAPRSPAVVVPLALRQIQANPSSGDASAAVRATLASDPLSPTAFLTLGLAAQGGGEPERAAGLVERASRLNPRSSRSRAWLLEHSLRRGDYEGAVTHIDRLLLLRPSIRPQMLAALALLAGEPSIVPAIADIVARRPNWSPNFFEALGAQRADPAVMRRLLEPIATAGSREKSQYLHRLVDAGHAAEAKRALAELLGPGQPSPSRIHDGTFRNLAGLDPFTWRLTPSEQGSAEFMADGGLRADYRATAAAVFAEQMLVLEPGAYALVLRGRVSPGTVPGAIAWTLSCADGRPLGTLALPVGDQDRAASTPVAVPSADCETQTLVLAGTPADFAQSATAETRSIDLAPNG